MNMAAERIEQVWPLDVPLRLLGDGETKGGDQCPNNGKPR